MLRKLPYEEFIKICKIFNYSFFRDDIKEMINSLKKEMPEDVYEYFRKILELAEKEEGSIWNLFYNVYHNQLEIANSYLACENNYLETRKKITDTKVNLYFEDARKIPELVDASYDIIILSNISDYLGKADILLTVEDFKAYIASFYDLLNKEGLLIDYLYRINCKYIISNSLVTVDDLGKGNVVACTRNLGYYRVRK